MDHLGQAAKDYAKARQDAVKKDGDQLSGATGSSATPPNGGFQADRRTRVQRVAGGENTVKAALGGVPGIKEKVKGPSARASGGSGNKKFMNIIEDIYVGVPVDIAYDQWTQFQEFASFVKGVESVDQTDDVSSNWQVKVFWSSRTSRRRSPSSPDDRIAWTSEGAKGTTKGVVTFHRSPTTSPGSCWSSSTTRRACSRRPATSGAPRAAAPGSTSSTSPASSRWARRGRLARRDPGRRGRPRARRGRGGRAGPGGRREEQDEEEARTTEEEAADETAEDEDQEDESTRTTRTRKGRGAGGEYEEPERRPRRSPRRSRHLRAAVAVVRPPRAR